MKAKASGLLPRDYYPEIYVSNELESNEASYFQSLIGVLMWMVDLGRVDICTKVSMLLSHRVLTRKGHLDALFYIFAYLKTHHNSEMVFDPSEPEIDMIAFPREDWSMSIYGDISEELPPTKPFEESGPVDAREPRGRGFCIVVYVYCNLGGYCVTRRSRTGFAVFINGAPFHWMSEKQSSCEVSTFGSEFTAMKQALEYVRGLQYKL